jgi:hypothetical protein
MIQIFIMQHLHLPRVLHFNTQVKEKTISFIFYITIIEFKYYYVLNNKRT